MKDTAAAISNIEKAISLDNENAGFLMQRGKICFQQREYNSAKNYFELALKKDPENLPLNEIYALNLNLLNDTIASKSWYEDIKKLKVKIGARILFDTMLKEKLL